MGGRVCKAKAYFLIQAGLGGDQIWAYALYKWPKIKILLHIFFRSPLSKTKIGNFGLEYSQKSIV